MVPLKAHDWSSWILAECNLSWKIVKYCILSEVCMINTVTHSTVSPQMWCIKSIKGWFTLSRCVGKILWPKLVTETQKIRPDLFSKNLSCRSNLLWWRAIIALECDRRLLLFFGGTCREYFMESAGVRYLRTSCWCVRNRTSERSEQVRFLIQKQRVHKYRTKHFPCSIVFIICILRHSSFWRPFYFKSFKNAKICRHTLTAKWQRKRSISFLVKRFVKNINDGKDMR